MRNMEELRYSRMSHVIYDQYQLGSLSKLERIDNNRGRDINEKFLGRVYKTGPEQRPYILFFVHMNTHTHTYTPSYH